MEVQFHPLHAMECGMIQSLIVCPTGKPIVPRVKRGIHPLHLLIIEECHSPQRRYKIMKAQTGTDPADSVRTALVTAADTVQAAWDALADAKVKHNNY